MEALGEPTPGLFPCGRQPQPLLQAETRVSHMEVTLPELLELLTCGASGSEAGDPKPFTSQTNMLQRRPVFKRPLLGNGSKIHRGQLLP